MVDILKEAAHSEHQLHFTVDSCDEASRYLQDNINTIHLEIDHDGELVIDEICYLSVSDIYHIVEATKLLVQIK